MERGEPADPLSLSFSPEYKQGSLAGRLIRDRDTVKCHICGFTSLIKVLSSMTNMFQ